MAEGEGVAGVGASMFGFGVAVTYVSIVVATLFAADEYVVAAGEVGSEYAGSSGMSVLVYLTLVAPFLAVVVWTDLHGVEVTVFGIDPGSVPFLGVVDGGLGVLLPVTLFLAGVTVAADIGGPAVLGMVAGTVTALITYVLGAAVIAIGSAFVFNMGVTFLAGFVSGLVGIEAEAVPTIYAIHYPDPTGAALRIGRYALPIVAVGAIVGGLTTVAD